MKKIMMILVAILLLSACGPKPDDMDAPVSSDMPVEPVDVPYLPKPDDANWQRGEAFVNSSSLIIRESFPPQIALQLDGDLPTPCHELRAVVHEPDAENNIEVEVYSVSNPELFCAQVIAPFSQQVELGTFASGHYTVSVNGSRVGEFDS